MGTFSSRVMSKGAVVTRFCDFLKARQDAPPPMPPGFLIHLPPGDCAEAQMVAPEPEADDPDLEAELGFAQNQTFVIAYESSDGRESVRRITVRNLSLNGENVPVLNAWCHERQALRAFRIDRVHAVVTQDGEVVEPPARFFVETFGMAPGLAACTLAKPQSLTRIRPLFTHHMMVLAHLGRIDGSFCLDEQGIVLEHCLKLAQDGGKAATGSEERALRRYLKTLKPKKMFLRRAMAGLEKDSAARIIALLTTADQVINADGIRHPSEQSFFGLLQRDLTGVH
jgi:Predicted transcriptional regulator